MNRPIRRGLIGLTAFALGAGGLGLAPSGTAAAPALVAAAAAPTTVDDATFTWDLSDETTSGAFAPGTWNLMSAGRIADPGSGGATLRTADDGATWSNSEPAGWTATAGEVTVEDLRSDGTYAPATFAGTRTDTHGANADTGGVRGQTRLRFSGGEGTVDPAAGTARLAWDGDATLLFYSGMTFFYLSDPVLDVAADGTGTVTATVGGYATSMDDPSAWNALSDRSVTVATLSGVDVTETGIATTPAYREVAYTAPPSGTQQVRTGGSWGAFPQSFVDFQQQVGQGPYWYSSGGSADPRKVANPLAVSYDAVAAPQVTVSRTTFLPSGEQQVVVRGTGFDPSEVTATRPPLAGRSGGVYVVVGKFAEPWRPSAGAAATSRKTTSTRWAVPAADMATVGGTAGGAVELAPDGSFTATLVVDKTALDAAAATDPSVTRYGVYTYPGGGAVDAAYETATPLRFAAAKPELALSVPATVYGRPSQAVVTVAGRDVDGSSVPATGTVTLRRGGAVVGTADLVDGRAVFALGVLGVGAHRLTATFSGSSVVAAGSVGTGASVARATTTTSTGLVRKPTRRKAGTLRVAVSSPTTVPTGAAVVRIRKNGRSVRTVPVTLQAGTATVTLPRGRGRYRVVTSYAGTADVAASTRTVTYRVR